MEAGFTITQKSANGDLVFGYCSTVADTEGNLLIDDGRDMIPPYVIEDAAYEYNAKHRQSSVMHVLRGQGELIESVILTAEKRQAMGLEPGPTAWWVGFRVTNPDTLAAIKSGELSEFSVGGWSQKKDHPELEGVSIWTKFQCEEIAFVDVGAGIGVSVAMRKRREGGKSKGERKMKLVLPRSWNMAVKAMAPENSKILTEKVEKMEGLSVAPSLQDIMAKLSPEESAVVMAALEDAMASPTAEVKSEDPEPEAKEDPEPEAKEDPEKEKKSEDPEPEEKRASLERIAALEAARKSQDLEIKRMKAESAQREEKAAQDLAMERAEKLTGIPYETAALASGLAELALIQKRNPKAYEKVKELEIALFRANKALLESETFSVLGKGGNRVSATDAPGSAGAIARIQKAASDLVEKDGITMAAALTRVAKSKEHERDYGLYTQAKKAAS